MKQTIRLVILAVILAAGLPALTRAQTPAGSAGECTEENKAKFYTQYYENRKDHQDVAYDAAKKYLAACPDAGPEDVYAKTLKKFVKDYEAMTRKTQFLAAYEKKNSAEVMTLGKQVLAEDPNYIRAYLLMGNLGTVVFPTVVPESLEYAKKAIELLEAGKAPDDWRPFGERSDDAAGGKPLALAQLNYVLGFATKKNSPTDAIPFLLKAAQLETPIKKNPGTYYYLATAYEAGPYTKLTEDYNRLYKDKPKTPESALAQANIDQLIDRIIDAYARAVALATSTDPKIQETRKESLARLTELYTYRHNNSDTGLNELIAGVLSKPVPDFPVPLTTLPTPPATGAAAPGTTPAVTPSGTTAPQPSKPAAISTAPAQPGKKTTTAPKTTTPSTSQTTKPKPKANHRRHP